MILEVTSVSSVSLGMTFSGVSIVDGDDVTAKNHENSLIFRAPAGKYRTGDRVEVAITDYEREDDR